MSKDRRQYSRIAVVQQAVLIQEDAHCLCRPREVSAGRTVIATESRPAVGVRVTLFAGGIGQFDAAVVRRTEQGVALRGRVAAPPRRWREFHRPFRSGRPWRQMLVGPRKALVNFRSRASK